MPGGVQFQPGNFSAHFYKGEVRFYEFFQVFGEFLDGEDGLGLASAAADNIIEKIQNYRRCAGHADYIFLQDSIKENTKKIAGWENIFH
jgi:hypothetical protein